MRKTLLCIAGIGIIAGTLVPAAAYNGKLVNGKAVSVQWSFGWKDWAAITCESGDGFRDGALLLYTVDGSRVIHCDTIHSRAQGLAQYPAFNLAGTKIAFYRLGVAPAATGNGCLSVNGGKHFISTINPDGTGLTDLVELAAKPSGGMFPLDWPAGDWIYYEQPHDAAHSHENSAGLMIWKVNAVTKAAQKVANLTKDGSGAELVCAYLHRFTLTLKGDYAAFMTYPKYGCNNEPVSTEYFSHVNGFYSFPPPNGNLGSSCIGWRNGCNASISPSGRIVGSYFAGWHDDMQLGTVNYATANGGGVGNDDPTVGLPDEHVWITQDLEVWAGEEIGNGAECIRWSANSDKWVGQCIGFVESGHADNQSKGSNQVICNFVDQVAINVSKNPRVTGGDVNGQGVIYWNNCTGDFWVDDPANNPNGNKYEDLQGIWHNVDGTPVRQSDLRTGLVDAPAIAVRPGSARAVHVSVQGNAPWSIGIAGVDGRTLHTLTGTSAGDITVPVPSASGRVAVVTLTQNGMRVVKRCVLR